MCNGEELLTLKAVGLLAAADVVHDDLVPPAVLAYAERALIVNVGKRSTCYNWNSQCAPDVPGRPNYLNEADFEAGGRVDG